MRRRIFLHVGPPKTATTYLQHILRTSTESLRERGMSVFVAQGELRDAASDLIGRSPAEGVPIPTDGWSKLRDQVAAAAGDVMISCERFSLLRAAHATTIRDAFEDSELQVILTYRDPGSQLPSRWQERIKNGGTESWAEYCELLVTDPSFRKRMLRFEQPLTAWSEVLPAEQIKVVTVPGAGAPRDLVLHRFCEAAGLDPATMVISEDPAANPAIGAAEAELLRRFNVVNRPQDGPPRLRGNLRQFLFTEALRHRPRGERLVLTPEAFDVAQRDTDQVIATIRRNGHPVFGDLDDLVGTRPQRSAGTVTEADVVEVAVDALTKMVQGGYHDRRRLRELQNPRTVPRRLFSRMRRRS